MHVVTMPTPARLGLPTLCCLVILLLTYVRTQGPAPEDEGSSPSSPAFVVCTVSRPPMSTCTPSSNSSALFSGLSIETFREVAESALGWKEGEQYMFTCLESGTSETINERLVPEGGGCDAFIAATTITAERTAAGVQFAYPYWSGSISAVVQNKEKNSDGWAWTRPFTWQLWLALGITSICLPLVIFVLEVLSIKRRVSLRDSASGYHESLWRTLWVLLQVCRGPGHPPTRPPFLPLSPSLSPSPTHSRSVVACRVRRWLSQIWPHGWP